MAKIVADQRARGGSRGRPIVVVLVASMILLGIALVALMLWMGGQAPTSPQQAASENANRPTSSANTSGVPTENPAYPAPAAPKSGTPGSAATSR